MPEAARSPASSPDPTPGAPGPRASAFVALSRRLKRLLSRKGASAEDAEDIVQDALLRYELFRRRGEVRDPEAFVARTAMNLAIDGRRRAGRSPIGPADEREVADPAPGPEALLAARRRMERLKDGLKAMNRKTRDVILAQRLDGRTYAEIAAAEGVSVSAIEKRVARGVLFLQGWMEGW